MGQSVTMLDSALVNNNQSLGDLAMFAAADNIVATASR